MLYNWTLWHWFQMKCQDDIQPMHYKFGAMFGKDSFDRWKLKLSGYLVFLVKWLNSSEPGGTVMGDVSLVLQNLFLWSVLWWPMTCQHKEPGHQQYWYWHSFTILCCQHIFLMTMYWHKGMDQFPNLSPPPAHSFIPAKTHICVSELNLDKGCCLF